MNDVHATSGHVDHGPHPRPPAVGEHVDEIKWLPAYALTARARPLQWTCRRCQPTYYLHVGAGRMQIERVTGRESVVTPPMLYADGRELWSLILRGEAR